MLPRPSVGSSALSLITLNPRSENVRNNHFYSLNIFLLMVYSVFYTQNYKKNEGKRISGDLHEYVLHCDGFQQFKANTAPITFNRSSIYCKSLKAVARNNRSAKRTRVNPLYKISGNGLDLIYYVNNFKFTSKGS